MRHSVDIYVGGRLKSIRRIKNMSQTEVGKAVGVSFQQLQKYECASNRISASRLYELATFFEVGVGFFFEGYVDRQTDSEGLR